MAHTHSHQRWAHDHAFGVGRDRKAERRTTIVVVLTAITMVAEIVAGWWYGSMALTADGWHMGSHAAALGVTVIAFVYARRHAKDPRFTYGTGKVSSLGGFASAVALLAAALMVGWDSAAHLIEGRPISFDQAIAVAVVGLAVNLVSALMLAGHGHGHDHDHDHEHEHDRNRDQNHALRGAFLHVAADALTSVLAIGALLGGKYFALAWLDPAMGIVAMVLIGHWSIGLLRDSAKVLLDVESDRERADRIREALESDGTTKVVDLHVWTVAPRHDALVASVVSHEHRQPDEYKARLEEISHLEHVTIEVNACCPPAERRTG